VNPTVESWLPTIIFVPLVAFALYRRVKRSFGRQRVAPKRMIARIILLSVLSVAFLASMPTARGVTGAAVGTAAGVVLAIYALKHTQYDVTSTGRGYTPNPWIGLVVTALFLGRLGARMFSIYEARVLDPSATPNPSIQRSPLTLGIFFVMATYYVAYYAGVLRKARGLDVADTPPA
jgi:hypothetical protein